MADRDERHAIPVLRVRPRALGGIDPGVVRVSCVWAEPGRRAVWLSVDPSAVALQAPPRNFAFIRSTTDAVCWSLKWA